MRISRSLTDPERNADQQTSDRFLPEQINRFFLHEYNRVSYKEPGDFAPGSFCRTFQRRERFGLKQLCQLAKDRDYTVY